MAVHTSAPKKKRNEMFALFSFTIVFPRYRTERSLPVFKHVIKLLASPFAFDSGDEISLFFHDYGRRAECEKKINDQITCIQVGMSEMLLLARNS